MAATVRMTVAVLEFTFDYPREDPDDDGSGAERCVSCVREGRDGSFGTWPWPDAGCYDADEQPACKTHDASRCPQMLPPPPESGVELPALPAYVVGNDIAQTSVATVAPKGRAA